MTMHDGEGTVATDETTATPATIPVAEPETETAPVSEEIAPEATEEVAA